MILLCFCQQTNTFFSAQSREFIVFDDPEGTVTSSFDDNFERHFEEKCVKMGGKILKPSYKVPTKYPSNNLNLFWIFFKMRSRPIHLRLKCQKMLSHFLWKFTNGSHWYPLFARNFALCNTASLYTSIKRALTKRA